MANDNVHPYCCHGFKNAVSRAGDRGLAFVTYKGLDQRIRFLMQSRGVDFDKKAELVSSPNELCINVVSDLGFRYCPFCACAMETLVAQSSDFFEHLRMTHKEYLEAFPGSHE